MDYILDEVPQMNEEQQKLLAGAMENFKACQGLIALHTAPRTMVPADLEKPGPTWDYNQHYFVCSSPETK